MDSNDNKLEAKLEKYYELWHEFGAIQTKIDELLPESQVAERKRFENVFFRAATRSNLAQKYCVCPQGESIADLTWVLVIADMRNDGSKISKQRWIMIR